MAMSEAAKAARREYYKKYREEHREEISERRKDWAKQNPERIREYNRRTWERMAAKKAAE